MIRNNLDLEAFVRATGIIVVMHANDPRQPLPKGALVAAYRAVERLVNAERKPNPRAAK